MSTVINIYADGACRGNPGPGGWGVHIDINGQVEELWGGDPNTTNNKMELTAAIQALDAFHRPITATLRTDSQYVIKGISEWIKGWKRNGWKTADRKPVKNVELWRQLDRLNNMHTIEWVWVKGHAGDVGNERVDVLANRGIDELKP